MMQFDKDRIHFLNMLPGRKTIQLFQDNKETCKEYPRFFHIDGDLYSKFDWVMKLEDLNALGMGVYMCVNETDGQGRSKENIIRVRAAVADLDGAPLEPVWKYEPSMVIETSQGKYHAYWKSSDIPMEGFTQIQKAIAHNLNSDPKVCDTSRVFRVPGFFHSKGERFLSRIIAQTDVEYSFRELQEMFPPKPVKQWSAEKFQKAEDYPTDGEYKGDYGATKGGRNSHIASRIGGMLKRSLPWNVIEHEAMKEACACSPPLPEREVHHILKSLRRYA